jgi:hypothetical protein
MTITLDGAPSSPVQRQAPGWPYLVPLPDCEPPFDDERSAADRVRMLRPAARRRRTVYRSETAVPATVLTKVPRWSNEPDIGIRPTRAGDLPVVARPATMLARGLVEVLSGVRPVEQLRAHCAPEVFAGLEDLPMVPGPGLPTLLSVRSCEPGDGVAEVSAVFRRAGRVRALAFRLEGVDGRWRLTALQVG